ncbi:hypothetical protein pb186bvf_012885 [Paramecium bursaria]
MKENEIYYLRMMHSRFQQISYLRFKQRRRSLKIFNWNTQLKFYQQKFQQNKEISFTSLIIIIKFVTV